ncbi:MAG: helix-turn-helix domain-containing protein [Acidobacteria bacterium]|nr:helix-turn-helix domain-containing protein [Acidobacteriota bacterium]
MCVARHDTISGVTGSESRSTGIGRFIRQHVVPAGMTVTEAARRLGVGRPALSNLLNGRAALSQEMALRLEGTFGADRAKLLELQAASDRDRRSVEDRAVAVGTYAPSFLTIKARQIVDWAAGNIRAREHLPVLLRRLIHATGRELRHVDFPGYDNAQRHGWDGWIEADAATPWVPEGRSGWEFGVDQRPGAKADRDYQARLKTISPAERAECAFVFVTPRNWEGKDRWARGKEAAGDWKAVRALDASDLEQWLETTIAPRIWLAEELEIPTEGFETLGRSWRLWAEASNPPLTPAIFGPSVAAHVKDFKKWLEMACPDRPFTVAADSRDEAVAFVACLLRHKDVPERDRDRAVVFKAASTLRTLAQSSSPFMPIVDSEEAERELATLYRQRHCIVVRPRNAVDREPDVAVELLGHAAFEEALADMGIERDRFDRLASESGRSPTVLRRRLSRVPAVGTPPWVGDREVARSLIPMVLVGAWHTGSKADCEVLAALAGHDYEEVEKSVADLRQRNDCPVWCVGQYRGVVSKIDALFAVSPWMTDRDVTDFVDFAEYVLSESDPVLELPEDERWLADIYGKVREHSSALRNGICETLVMLSVHGNALFQSRLGVDVRAYVAALVKRLLTPFTSDKLRSHEGDIPGYAEAAPEEFLSRLEEDLRQPQPVLHELLKPVGPGLFEHPARTGMLWALERLAWNPTTFMRVVVILARLSEKRIDDNWMNKPINSLSAVFRSWLPQTAAPLDDRIRALEVLCRRFPDVGWQICIQQFEGRQQVGHFNARPRWRNDAAGAGRGVGVRERYEFARKALDLAISWPEHDNTTLGDLIGRIDAMPEKDQITVWNRVDAWSQTETDDSEKADLRQKIRGTIFAPRAYLRGLDAELKDRVRSICEKLASGDSVRRNAWLFHSGVEHVADELDDGHLDFNAREKRVDELRTEAMKEIWSSRGLAGAFALLADCDPWTVGRYASCRTGDQQVIFDVLQTCLATEPDSSGKLDGFIQGFIWFIDEDVRSTIVSTLAETATVDQYVRLLVCSPFRQTTWHLLDRQNSAVRDRYWRTVIPRPWRFSESETNEIIDRFLDVKRSRAAFLAVRFDWDKVETSRLKRLLSAIAKVDTEPASQYEIEAYYLSEALDALGGRPGVTVDEMAQLEFACMGALEYSEHGIPNLERKIGESPSLFVQAVALLFKRKDDGPDPPEWRVDDSAYRASLQHAAFRLFQQVTRVPGAADDGGVDADALSQWVTEVRRLCEEHGRAAIGDQQIGQLLSRAPAEKDGPWPCRAVCEVLETTTSQDIAAGFEMGVYNARGVHSRSLDEGGEQERELSARYRGWAEQLVFDYPYVASILERIATGYDRDAEREDSEVLVMKRLEH